MIQPDFDTTVRETLARHGQSSDEVNASLRRIVRFQSRQEVGNEGFSLCNVTTRFDDLARELPPVSVLAVLTWLYQMRSYALRRDAIAISGVPAPVYGLRGTLEASSPELVDAVVARAMVPGLAGLRERVEAQTGPLGDRLEAALVVLRAAGCLTIRDGSVHLTNDIVVQVFEDD